MDSFKLKNQRVKHYLPVIKGVLSKEDFREHLNSIFTRVV